MKNNYSAALDLSGRTAGFALLDNGKPVFSLVKPMRGRDSAQLAAFVGEELAKAGVKLDEISGWTVGSGPGSFTGMRIAAALVAGWTFARPEIAKRCVPTAVALAANLDGLCEGDRIGTLFDGRNKELIFFELEVKNGEAVPTGRETVLNAEQAGTFFAAWDGAYLAALECELGALRLLLAPEVAEKVRAFGSIRPEALVLAKYKPYDQDLTDLVYIRPAVFTA